MYTGRQCMCPLYMKEITDEDLILYIYQEAPPFLKALIDKELSISKDLTDRLNRLKQVHAELDRMKLTSPSPSVIKKIIRKVTGNQPKQDSSQ